LPASFGPASFGQVFDSYGWGVFLIGAKPRAKKCCRKGEKGEEKRREGKGRKKEGGEPRKLNPKCKANFTNFAHSNFASSLLCKISIKNLQIK
jgi:hypothetical protein